MLCCHNNRCSHCGEREGEKEAFSFSFVLHCVMEKSRILHGHLWKILLLSFCQASSAGISNVGNTGDGGDLITYYQRNVGKFL